MGRITVSGLGKAYKKYPTRWSRLAEWLLPFSKSFHTLSWVLQDINFNVSPGEAVGIVGMNGAGKSTLLKMIAGTTQPTKGKVSITGSVSALLELGMGFHPEFTGRENVYMSGQLLGYSLDELHRLMPEIESFAEIGEYIDQPVRMYSSGMQMRLAFSVATARRPNVLIVDEALSVGDTYFQHKSFDRIRQYRDQGTTLLLVSHEKASIQAICNRAILLSEGKLIMEGEPESVMDFYNAKLSDKQNQTIEISDSITGKVRIDSGTREAEILQVSLLNQKGDPIDVISVGQAVIAKVEVRVNSDIPGLVLGFGVKDRLGQMMFGTNTFHTKQKLDLVKAGAIVNFSISFNADLGVGTYSIHCALVENDSHTEKSFHWIDRAALFEVINTDKPIFVGCMWNPINFKIQVNQNI